jgi:hypothetical protein
MIMVLVAFACFLVLMVAWLMAANVEGEPKKVAEPATLKIEGKAVAEIA